MGNVCCQTDVNTNALENEILRIDEYQEAQLPQNDQSIKQWLDANQITLPSDEAETNMPVKTMRQINGERYYVGAWKKGVPEGKGFIYEPRKMLFLGTFQNGIPEGQSSINFIEEGIQFKGTLKNGKANGSGTIDNLHQKFRFVGQWQNSKPSSGTLTLSLDPNISTIQIFNYSNGDAIIQYKDNRKYEGTINTSRLFPHGKGKVQFFNHPSKVYYQGNWLNGQIHGQGKFVYKDGSEYEGDFIKGRKEGTGKFTFPNQNYYYGYWIGGKQNGTGTLFNKNNQQLKKGVWKDGVFQNSLDEESYKKQSKIFEERASTSKKEAEDIFKKEEQQSKVQSQIRQQNSLSSDRFKNSRNENEDKFSTKPVHLEEKKNQQNYYD